MKYIKYTGTGIAEVKAALTSWKFWRRIFIGIILLGIATIVEGHLP